MPVATVELKTDFTQSVERRDRPVPLRPAAQAQGAGRRAAAELSRAARWSTSPSATPKCMMTTRLDGPATALPAVQQGRRRRGGQPAEPDSGHRTAYLWEEVWAARQLAGNPRPLPGRRAGREEADREASSSRATTSSTPRASCRPRCWPRAPGGKYLIQHSAGSGKTNSIAWSAHFLADLHDAQHKKLFDTVLVVSDRNVIDTPASGSDLRLRADDRRGRDDQERRRQQERRSWPRRSRATRRSSSARSRRSPSPWRRCASWRRRRASGSR